MTTVMLGVVFGVALVGIVVWSNVVKRAGIMNVWRLGFAVLTVGFIPLFFANTMPVAVAIMCVMGMGVAGCLVTIDCIGAKIIDDDYSRHGVKREGMLTSLVGVMNRLNGLYVSLGYKIISVAFGFESGANPGSNPDMASRFLLCVFPFIAMAVATIFTLFLHFKDESNDWCNFKRRKELKANV